MNEWVKGFSNKKQVKAFIESMFELNPNKRATAAELVNHSFFDQVRDEYENLMSG